MPTSPTLARNLLTSVAQHRDRPALRLDDQVVSFADLDDASARVAALLRSREVEVGDRVAVMLPNVPQFAMVYYGIQRVGAIVVPMNPLLKGREVAFYLGDSGARLIFAWHESADQATAGARETDAQVVVVTPETFAQALAEHEADERVADRSGEDTAVILYTSGTTGKPKGAELTQANLTHNLDVTARTLLQLSPEDVVLGALPLFHSFGQTCGLNAAVATGACLTLIPRFDAGRALEVIQRDRVTVFEGVPTMYAGLLHHAHRDDYDVSTLRVCISGGAAMPIEIMRSFEKAFDATVLEGYGLSETSPVASFNQPGQERKPGSIGTPVEGVQMSLHDDRGHDVEPGEVGEIVIRGRNVMKGYWGRPDATREAISDEWFRSGDLATRDKDGYYFIVDRKKELIIRGGYNVYPREIEEVLYEHPAVAEAAVIGIPHDELGEEVGAAVALKDGQSATPDELREHVKAQVANYKYPRHVWIVDALPKGPTGKLQKREITVPDDARSS